MGRRMKVRRRVPLRGVVTAADVAALLTHPQVDPVPSALGQAVLTAGRRRLDLEDLIEMGAGLSHSISLQCVICLQIVTVAICSVFLRW
jgi:hypothetical protein